MEGRESKFSQIAQNVYDLKLGFIFKLNLVALSVFMLSLVINFPVKKVITGLVDSALTSNRNCPMSYDNIKTTFFPLGIKIDKLKIDGRCFGKRGAEVFFQSATANLGFPSLSPFGPSVHAHVSKDSTDLKLAVVPSFSETLIRLKNSTIHSDLLNLVMDKGTLFKGNFNLEGRFYLEKNRLNKGDFLLKSTNFKINNTTVENFEIPSLAIGNVLLKAVIAPKSIEIENMILGKDTPEAPLNAQFKGTIRRNLLRFEASSYDLQGQFRLGESLLKSVSILEMILPKDKQDKQGYFRVKMKGQISKPGMPEFL